MLVRFCIFVFVETIQINNKGAQTMENTTKDELQNNANENLIPVSKWEEHHKYPTVKAIRQLIFFKKKNGFAKVLRKIGGRLYIAENDFYKWVEETGRVAV